MIVDSWRAHITVNHDQCGGRPCVRGMRIRVTDVIDLMACGLSQNEILIELPDLKEDDISAVLKYASFKLKNES